MEDESDETAQKIVEFGKKNVEIQTELAKNVEEVNRWRGLHEDLAKINDDMEKEAHRRKIQIQNLTSKLQTRKTEYDKSTRRVQEKVYLLIQYKLVVQWLMHVCAFRI